MIIENMKGKVVDIDNAFLNGDLEHEIYMKIPEGYDEVINPGVDKEDCLILQKAIYGLVQAARQFWKKIVDKMQEGGFKLSEADPCMLYKEDEKWVCIIIIYIDDMLIIGKEEAIDDAIKVLHGHFQVKDPTSLEDYLGVQIVQSDDGKKAWLGQPTTLRVRRNNLERELQRRQLHQGHQGLLVERWMIFQRWMRNHNPCTGQAWEHCCISPSTADLIPQTL